MSEQLNVTEDLLVTISEFKGKSMVSLRKWFEKDGVMTPGKNGLNVDVETWNKIVAKWDEIKAFVETELKK